MKPAAAVLVACLGIALPALAREPAPEPPPFALSDAARVIGAPAGPARSGAALDAETARVGQKLRCPVCQGLSVADSPATMAVNMRHQVKELLAAGYSEEQILGYFEGSYGEFVRLEPPMRGVNWTLWLAPVAGLLAGGFLVFRLLSGGARPSGPAPVETPAEPVVAAAAPAVDRLPDDPELARAVLRVREMAYGWPGGVRPQKVEG